MFYKSVISSRRRTRLAARLTLAVLLLAAVIVATLTYHPLFAQSQGGTIDNLRLSSDSPGELRATWDTPSPAPSDYRISWAPASQGYLSWRDSNQDHRGNSYPGGDTTSFTLTGLPEGTEFKIRVRARYNAGRYANNRWSGPWNEQAVTVASQPEPVATATPATSTQATSTQATSTQATSTQATSTPATSTQATSTQATSTQATSTQATSTQATSTQATSTQATSTQATSTPQLPPKPVPRGTVTGLTLTSDAPGSLTIEWDTPSPSPTDYRINWARTDLKFLSWRLPNEESRGNEYPDGNTNSLTLTGLTEGAEFRVQMRARYRTNGHWSGPWTASVTQQVLSETKQATSTATSTPPATSTATTTLSATTTIQATTTSTTTSDIGAPTNLTATLQRSVNALGGGSPGGIGTRSFSNGTGAKSFSDGIGTRETETLATSSMYVMLSWSNPTGGVEPTGYQVRRWVTGNHPAFFDCDDVDSSTTSSCYSAEEYRDSQLTAGVTFNYRVRLVKRAPDEDPRWSPWSDTVTIEIPAGLTADSYPEAPAGLTAFEVLHATSSPKASLNWDAVSGASMYRIYRVDRRSATPTADVIATTTATSYDDEDIRPYRSYQYRVQAVNSLGLGSPLSRIWMVNTSGLQYGVPDRPTALSATTTDITATTTVDLGMATSSDIMITLSWTPAMTGTTTTHYRISAGVVTEEMYRAYEHPEDAVITVRTVRITTSTSATFLVGSGSLYAFGAKSCNGNGCSSLSVGLLVNLIGELGADPNAPGQPTTPGTG